MFNNICSFLFTLILLISPLFSIAQIEIKAEIRPRAELRNGFKAPREKDMDPAFFVEQRSRLYVNYLRDRFELHMALQDVRIWGAVDQIYKQDPTLTNFYEAWARYNFAGNWWVKAGRQALDYDNARFLGDLDWAQQGRSHDALLIQYQGDTKFQIHAGAAFNQNVFEPAKLSGTEYFGVNNYKTMQYVWFHNETDLVKYSLLFHNDGRQTQDTSVAFRQTYGLFSTWSIGQATLGGEFYYQGGKNQNDQNVSAFLISLSATMPTDITPVTLGFDYLSGTKIDDTDDHSFNPLYGTNHKFYGFMDHFYVGNPHSQGNGVTGLFDVFLKTNFKLSEKSILKGDLHYFRSPVELYNPENLTENIDNNLGSELDLVFIHSFAPDAKLWIGYSQLFASDGLIAVKNNSGNKSATQNWAWVMFQFKPTLLTKEL